MAGMTLENCSHDRPSVQVAASRLRLHWVTRWRTRFACAIAGILLTPSAYASEAAIVYGAQDPPIAGGAFRPAHSDLACFSVTESGQCFDGQQWHRLYPLGKRRYAKADGQVSCMIVMKTTHDCWDGRNWYRLPAGRLFGTIEPAISGGAFLITPLP